MHRGHERVVDSCLFVSSLSSLASFCRAVLACCSCGACKHFHIYFFCGACDCRKCRPAPSFLVLQAPPWPSLQVAHLLASSRKDISDMGALTFSDCFRSYQSRSGPSVQEQLICCKHSRIISASALRALACGHQTVVSSRGHRTEPCMQDNLKWHRFS